MIEVRRVSPNTFDLFIGKQWGTWIRVQKRGRSLVRIAGEWLPPVILRSLNPLIEVGMPITYGQDQEVTFRICGVLR